MWTWVLSGTCLLGGVVTCRVTGVSVGGRDLNWERIPLGEGQHWVYVDMGLVWYLSPGRSGPMQGTGVGGGGRDLNWERIPLVGDQPGV